MSTRLTASPFMVNTSSTTEPIAFRYEKPLALRPPKADDFAFAPKNQSVLKFGIGKKWDDPDHDYCVSDRDYRSLERRGRFTSRILLPIVAIASGFIGWFASEASCAWPLIKESRAYCATDFSPEPSDSGTDTRIPQTPTATSAPPTIAPTTAEPAPVTSSPPPPVVETCLVNGTAVTVDGLQPIEKQNENGAQLYVNFQDDRIQAFNKQDGFSRYPNIADIALDGTTCYDENRFLSVRPSDGETVEIYVHTGNDDEQGQLLATAQTQGDQVVVNLVGAPDAAQAIGVTLSGTDPDMSLQQAAALGVLSGVEKRLVDYAALNQILANHNLPAYSPTETHELSVEAVAETLQGLPADSADRPALVAALLQLWRDDTNR